jgi:diacylglycerol kinase family enzyme
MNRIDPAASAGPVQASAGAAGRDGRVCIVFNAGSGKKGGNGEAEQLRALAAAHPDEVELREVTQGRDIVSTCRQALENGFETIVAAGGDGTIGAVASCLADTGRRMGILPLGTFNYFARANNIPEDIGEAFALLHEGEAVPQHVGEVNGVLFLNNASLGIYPAILRERESIYRRWGRSRLAAYWSVVRTVAGFRRSSRLRVTVDGVEHRRRTPLVFVAFSEFQLDTFGLEGAEHVRRGELAVLVAPDCGRLGLLVFAVRLLARGMRRGTDFELFHGTDIGIEPSDPRRQERLIARDGEKEIMSAPFRFRVRRDALRVIVPKSSADAAV